MSLTYLVDGYNCTGNPAFASGHKKSQDHRTALFDFIRARRLCGSAKNRLVVVFDGYPPPEGFRCAQENAEVVFSRNQTADERIARLVDASAQRRNLVVVSDDKQVKFQAKTAGAGYMAVEDFFRLKETRKAARRDDLKPEINCTQMHRINQELRDLWLK
jgi:predicted RNA-binding protein with PIN domain